MEGQKECGMCGGRGGGRARCEMGSVGEGDSPEQELPPFLISTFSLVNVIKCTYPMYLLKVLNGMMCGKPVPRVGTQ